MLVTPTQGEHYRRHVAVLVILRCTEEKLVKTVEDDAIFVPDKGNAV